MKHLLWALVATFATSLIPGLELRAGIPVGLALGLPAPLTTAVATGGNILQIRVAMAAVAWAYDHAARLPAAQRWLVKSEQQVERHGPLIRRWGWLGLAGFVLLPFPGTGVWGGVVLARLLQVPAASAWLGIALGVLCSGLLWGLGFYGGYSLFRLFW